MVREADAQALRAWLGETTLPQDYWVMLASMPGDAPIGIGGVLYALQDLIERNETYEVRSYCPGYLNIGDNGGGSAILLDLSSGRVVIVEHGSMTEDGMEDIAPSFNAWREAGFRLPREGRETDGR